MNVLLYALMTYGVTAAISLAVIAIVLLINKILSRTADKEDENG